MSDRLRSIIRYFADRRHREELMAGSAACQAAIEAHRQLARHYAERLARLQTIARLSGIALGPEVVGWQGDHPAPRGADAARRRGRRRPAPVRMARAGGRPSVEV